MIGLIAFLVFLLVLDRIVPLRSLIMFSIFLYFIIDFDGIDFSLSFQNWDTDAWLILGAGIVVVLFAILYSTSNEGASSEK